MNLVAWPHILTEHLNGKLIVAPHGTEWNHNSFGVGGRAAGVVQNGQFIGRIVVVIDVARTEIHGVFLTEEAVEVFSRIPHFIRASDEKFVLIGGISEDAFEGRHLISV